MQIVNLPGKKSLKMFAIEIIFEVSRVLMQIWKNKPKVDPHLI